MGENFDEYEDDVNEYDSDTELLCTTKGLICSDFTKDKMRSNILQPLKNRIGRFIANDSKCKEFYKDKIGSKSALFISFGYHYRR